MQNQACRAFFAKVELKDYDGMINGQNIFDQPASEK